MSAEIEVAAVLFHEGLRRAADRRGVERAVPGDGAELADAIAHEQRAVGQEDEAPRRVEAGGEGLEAEGVALALDDGVGRHARELDAAERVGAGLLLQVGDHRVLLRGAEHGAEAGHARLRKPVADGAEQAGVVAAVLEFLGEDIRAGAAAGERRAVATGAEGVGQRGGIARLGGEGGAGEHEEDGEVEAGGGAHGWTEENGAPRIIQISIPRARSRRAQLMAGTSRCAPRGREGRGA